MTVSLLQVFLYGNTWVGIGARCGLSYTDYMSEPVPGQPDEKENKRVEYLELARELSAKKEKLSFPGVDPESYARLKASDEEFPGYVTPVDELIKRFESEGFKVVIFGKYATEDVYVQPVNSDSADQENCLFPRDLLVSDDMDEALKRLILANKQ